MKNLLIIPFLLISLYSCGQNQKVEYPSQVGDIYFDPKIDDPNFKLCDDTRVLQYYNLGKVLRYKGEKPKVIEHFKKGLKTMGKKTDTGYLTIRFIVNCNGQTGRFRIKGIDNNYEEKEFSNELSNQLLILTKQLDGWIVGKYHDKNYDYYQYLTFKIEKGKLIEIMP